MGGTMGEMTLTPCSFIALLKVLSLIRVIRTVSTFASARRAARSFLGRMGALLQRTPRGWDFGNRRALLVRPHSDRTRRRELDGSSGINHYCRVHPFIILWVPSGRESPQISSRI